MRGRIAHLAARMIAEDGISDYGLAKRKAARQAGAPDSRNLPTNLEIEDALRAYQALYQADEQPERLQQSAPDWRCEMMRLLEPFNPHLTGTGAVGQRRATRRDHTCSCTPTTSRSWRSSCSIGRSRSARARRGCGRRSSAVVPTFQHQHARSRYSHHRAFSRAPAPAVAHIIRGPAIGARADRVGRNSGARRYRLSRNCISDEEPSRRVQRPSHLRAASAPPQAQSRSGCRRRQRA